MERVYPKLKQFCQELGYQFQVCSIPYVSYDMQNTNKPDGTSFLQVVDMRWGVREEAENDHMAVELCLKEIKLCQQLSTGPNFVVSSYRVVHQFWSLSWTFTTSSIADILVPQIWLQTFPKSNWSWWVWRNHQRSRWPGPISHTEVSLLDSPALKSDAPNLRVLPQVVLQGWQCPSCRICITANQLRISRLSVWRQKFAEEGKEQLVGCVCPASANHLWWCQEKSQCQESSLLLHVRYGWPHAKSQLVQNHWLTIENFT